MLQSSMEWLHISLGLEWFQAIAVTALCLRFVSFPLVVMSQRNMAKMTLYNPEMQDIQEKVSAARRRGDMLEMVSNVKVYFKLKCILVNEFTVF